MKKRALINEVRQLQKIAGILKEEDLELSDTPQFASIPKTVEEFLDNEDFVAFIVQTVKDNMDGIDIEDMIERCIVGDLDLDELIDYWEAYKES